MIFFFSKKTLFVIRFACANLKNQTSRFNSLGNFYRSPSKSFFAFFKLSSSL